MQKQVSLHSSKFMVPFLKIALRSFGPQEVIELLTVLDKFPETRYCIIENMPYSKELFSLLRQSPIRFQNFQDLHYFTAARLTSWLTSGAGLDDILFLFNASGIRKLRLVDNMIELCSKASDDLLLRPEVASILVGLYENIPKDFMAFQKLSLLLACLRLRGVLHIDEEVAPIELLDGTATAAILANRYYYLMNGIQQRIFNTVIYEPDEFYRNQTMIDFFKPIFKNDANVHYFVISIMKLDRRNDEILMLENDCESFYKYVEDCDYDNLFEVVLPIIRIKGMYKYVPELLKVISSVDNDDYLLFEELVDMCIYEADFKNPNSITLIKAVLKLRRYSRGPIIIDLDAKTFMFMIRDDKCRALMLELKRSKKATWDLDEQQVQKILHNDNYFNFILKHREEVLQMTCFYNHSLVKFTRLTSSQLARLLQLTNDTVEDYCVIEFEDTDFYRNGQFNSCIPLYAYVNMWYETDKNSLLSAINNDARNIVDLIDLGPKFQGELLLKLLPYMSQERQEITRLALALIFPSIIQ